MAPAGSASRSRTCTRRSTYGTPSSPADPTYPYVAARGHGSSLLCTPSRPASDRAWRRPSANVDAPARLADRVLRLGSGHSGFAQGLPHLPACKATARPVEPHPWQQSARAVPLVPESDMFMVDTAAVRASARVGGVTEQAPPRREESPGACSRRPTTAYSFMSCTPAPSWLPGQPPMQPQADRDLRRNPSRPHEFRQVGDSAPFRASHQA